MAEIFLSGSKVDEFCMQSKPIWVTNLTGSILMINIPVSGGQTTELRIPAGLAPFCISDYLPPDAIRQAPVLRRLISEGKLKLMDPDSMAGKRSARPVKNIANTGGTPESAQEMHSTPNENQEVSALDPELEELEASPQVSILCDSILQGDVKEEQFPMKIAEIKSKSGLTEQDLAHIISELKGKTKIIEWATNELAEMREKASAETPEVSTGTDDELEENAKELIARSAPRGVNATGEPGPGLNKVEHNTMTKQERDKLRESIKTHQ